MAFSLRENKGVARNLPPARLGNALRGYFLPGSPRRAPRPVRATALSDGFASLVLLRLPLLIPASASSPLRRRRGCRRDAARRLLDDVQSQLACLPFQRLDLL